MAFLFADSFDPYGSGTDLSSRYTTVSSVAPTLVPAGSTAFGAGQALKANATTSGTTSTFAWGSNETTVFGSLRLQYAGGGNLANYFYLSFQDGAANQCTIRWNCDGSINLYSGGPTGTLLGTYAGSFAAIVWDSWQFKIVVNNTAGSIELRKNGAPVDVINLSGVNTRAGSTNAYCNAFTYGWNSTSGSAPIWIDDFFLCSASGAAPNTWTGDIRSVQQVPSGQIQTRFTTGPSPTMTWGYTPSTASLTLAANVVLTTGIGYITSPSAGTATALTCDLVTGVTGNLKLALYDATGPSAGPGNLLGVTAAIVNPVGGLNTANLVVPVIIVSGVSYYVAILTDTAVSMSSIGLGGSGRSLPAAFSGGFPSSVAGAGSVANSGVYGTVTMTLTNLDSVGEAVGDGDSSFISSGSVGQEDIYTLSAIPATCTVTGVNYYAMWKKADAGPRTAVLSVSANGSTDTAEVSNAALSNSYAFSQQMLLVDPTGASWTPTSVNGAQIGIAVVA